MRCSIGRLAVLILILTSTLVGHATPKADSLKSVARNQQDSLQADTYLALARHYFQTEHVPDSMVKYAQLSAAVARKFHRNFRELKGLKALGLAYTEAGNFEAAEKSYAAAMVIAEAEKSVEEIININDKLGYLFGKANDLTKSAFYYLNSAKEYEKLKDYAKLAMVYRNVVVIFTIQDQPNKIRLYTDKALSLIPKINPETDADVIIDTYRTGAQRYFLLGEKLDRKSLIDSALVFADSCLNVAKRYGINSGLAEAYYIMGRGYLLRKDISKGFEYARKALAYRSEIPERTVFIIYAWLAKAYLDQDKYAMVSLYLDSCRQLTTSKELDAPLIMAEIKYSLYKKTGNNGAALTALEEVNAARKTIQDQERNKLINDLETKYQSELKEAKIAELNQQSKIDTLQIRSLIALAGVAVLLVIIVVVMYRQSLVKGKLSIMETEQRLNRARMNPHFFFNALTALQQVALRQNNGAAIASSLSQFSQVMRTTLDSTFDEFITLEQEITFLSRYADIQKVRYPDEFQFVIHHAPDLEIDEIIIPSLILQPFVENSIEHGLRGVTNGLISLEIKATTDELAITIADNGKGLFDKDNTPGDHISRATSIIRDRLYLLNTSRKTNARFTVEPSMAGPGVMVSIFLPLLYRHENSPHRQ
jgi:tetratricopeptide (TPR) repeat protein